MKNLKLYALRIKETGDYLYQDIEGTTYESELNELALYSDVCSIDRIIDTVIKHPNWLDRFHEGKPNLTKDDLEVVEFDLVELGVLKNG